MYQSHNKVCGKHISHNHHAYASLIHSSLISARNIIMEYPSKFYYLIFLLLTLLVTSVFSGLIQKLC